MHPQSQYPFPFMMPQIMVERERPQQELVPTRVRQAMEFLALLNNKTMTRAAASENQVIEIDGQKLTDEESVAQATACNLLAKYFSGKLPQDAWDKAKLRSNVPAKGTKIQCPACANNPRPGCLLCSGNGKVIVTPCTE